MSKELEFDLADTFEKFKKLSTQEMMNAIKRGMRKTAKQIQTGTVENAKQGIKTYNNHPNGKYESESILDAVRIGKLQDKYDEDMYLKVHVMGTGRPASKTFRFRFLEKGTKERYAKTYKGRELTKPRYLGKIQPRRYFARSVNTVDIEGIYLKEIQKSIEKLNNETA